MQLPSEYPKSIEVKAVEFFKHWFFNFLLFYSSNLSRVTELEMMIICFKKTRREKYKNDQSGYYYFLEKIRTLEEKVKSKNCTELRQYALVCIV